MKQNKLLFLTLCMLLWSGLTTKAQTYYINESFSTGTGATPPTGWTQNVIVGTAGTDTWRFNNPGSRSTTANANVAGVFAVFDADNYSGPSTGPDENVALESPAVATTGASVVRLKWDHIYRGINQSWGAVYVEVHNGTSWNQVYTSSASALFGATEDIDVSAFAANKAAVKVRFRFFDNWGWYWIVDNVQLYTPAPPPAYVPPTPVNLFLINEPFTTATGSTPPTGWSSNVISGLATEVWRFSNPGSRTVAAPITSPFATFDSDQFGNNGTSENVALESPTVSSRGYSVVRLKWDQKLDASFGGSAIVEVFNGTSWVSVYSSSTTNTSTQDINVSAQIANKAGIKVRFRWTGNWSMYWIVDNVQLYVPGPIYFVKEDFAAATGTTHRPGWANTVLGVGATSDTWRYNNPASRTVASPIVSPFAIMDADNTSNNSLDEDVALETPLVATTGQSTIKVKWDQQYRGRNQTWGTVKMEAFNGTTWNTIYTNNSTSTITTTERFDISADAGNKANTKLRFRYNDNWGWWWIVDNVEVYVPVQPTADFTINNATQCLTGNSFVFTNNSTVAYGAGMTYSWNFGDVTTSTAQDPVKTYAAAGTYTVTLTTTSATGETSVSTKTVTVTPTVTPSVSIASSAGSSFCPGTSVTFTATPTNAGTPTYQWKRNGSNVGTNSATFNSTTLTTGDVITVVMTPSTCVTAANATVTSNAITVNTTFTAAVTIGMSTPTNNICAGQSVTYTAFPTIPSGSTATYQWKKNGLPVGTNSTVYTVAPGHNDVITCEMTTTHACPTAQPAISNAITMVHGAPVVPTITLTKTPSTAICPGTAVQFSTTQTGGGPVPTYQWKVNGVNVATTANWGSSSLNNNDVVSVTMTSSICAAPTTATANTTISVNSNTPASVTISANPGTNICSGTGVTFTATPTGGGTPTYQWKRNGANVGTNSATYNAGTTLTNGNTIECVMTSSATCALPKVSNSNLITMNVTSTITPSVSISTIPAATACVGGVLQFIANPSGGGNTPSYQWKVDGNNVGTNIASYVDNGTLAVGPHTISVTMVSSVSQCISTTTATGTLNKTISPLVTPTVSVTSTQAPAGNACTGASVTFTPTSTNAGTTPTYQWKKNGVNVATGSSYPAGATLVTGDVITVEMTSTAACASPVVVNSAPQSITVWPNVAASVSISSNPAPNVSCTGLPVTFTAAPVNLGLAPTYQWKKNGVNVGSNSNTYVDAGLATGNTISCVVTSSIPCASPTPATSNTLTMTMNQNTTASINLSVTPDSVGCDKTPFTFNTFHVNGGTNPAFKWYKNGSPIPGAAQAVYSSNSLLDGDVITCELTSNGVCTAPVMSGEVSVDIIPSPVPTLSIAGVPDEQGINFVATLTDGGQNPTYQWRKNGHDIQGATGATYKGIGLNASDKINVFAHSDVECANPEFLLSNTLDVQKVTAINTVTTSFNELTLFPNPNGGRFTVKGTAKANTNSKVMVEVLNAVGQAVYKNATDLKGNELEVDVEMGGHNAAGMYMLRVTVDGHTDNLRFVVKD